MKTILLAALFLIAGSIFGQHKSIHQEELEYYNSLGLPEDDYILINKSSSKLSQLSLTKSNCNLDKIVFGWHPYWSNGKEDQYDWSLMSDLSFFSYEVDATTGNANTTHGWMTNDAVDSALANGLRVNLCVTLFSNHATLFGNPSAVQNLISNLISTVQARGAHGVNIDFEGISASQKTNFTNFMIDLCNQMHAAIPNSQVSTVLYAVDWNNIFDIAALDPYVDLYTIMGYAYYYSNSGTAGPTDPLYHFGSSYNYTLSKTVTDYLNKGANPDKLVLGLPYYGYEWPTVSASIPSATSGSGYSRTFQQIKNNTSGNYSVANETWEYNTFSTNYTFNSSGQKQAFINSGFDMKERLELINHTGIAGMAIWALGYDYDYTDYWDAIHEKFTSCGTKPCVDTLYDFGGPTRNYYNNENYTYTITANNASSLTLEFDTIDIENNYDYLYVYDGPDDTYPQIPGSPFTGQFTGFNWTSSQGDVTFKFTSDGATVASGWKLVYSCSQDLNPPSSQIDHNNNWETADFNVNFIDTDAESGVKGGFYLVTDLNGSEWSANSDNGFLFDNFNSVNTSWNNQIGTWQYNSNTYLQSDVNESNSNAWIDLSQSDQNSYLYEWDGLMSGAGSNKRSGIHFFCDDPTLPNRGNSYFVYFRADSDKAQIYKVVNDVWTLMVDNSFNIDANIWHNYKVTFDPTTGQIVCYVDGIKAAEWQDATPHVVGNSFSFRSGGCEFEVDDLKVYKSRGNNELITVGNSMSDIRFQNQNPFTPSAEVYSICLDSVLLWSNVDNKLVNIDWTEAGPLTIVDGYSTDIDTFYNSTELTAHWTFYQDSNSYTNEYLYAVGTSPGDSDVIAWTTNSLNTIFTESGLSLIPGTTYFTSVRSLNGAGIVSQNFISNGQLLLSATAINSENSSSIQAYPNPFNDDLNIQFDKALNEHSELLVYAVDGKLILQIKIPIGSNKVIIDTNQFAIGVYQVIIKSKSTMQSINVVKS